MRTEIVIPFAFDTALLMAAKGSRKKAWREVLAEVKADEGK